MFSKLVLSNFIAAFGGATLLSQAISQLSAEPSLKGGNLIAYLIGTLLGIGVLNSQRGGALYRKLALFSLSSAILSFVLLLLTMHYALLQGLSAWIFFAVLCLRFCAWFLARVTRTDIAADGRQSLSWVELSYFIGVILGLLVWEFSGWKISFSIYLIIDAFLQILVSFLDAKMMRAMKTVAADDVKQTQLHPLGTTLLLLMASAVLLTMATQIVEFAVVADVSGRASVPSFLANSILAASYAGAAVAAFLCARLRLTWSRGAVDFFLGDLSFSLRDKRFSVSFIFPLAFSLLPLAAAIHLVETGQIDPVWMVAMTAIASIFFEITVLPILDKIGALSKERGRAGTVALTYGFMGACGILFLILSIHFFPGMRSLLIALTILAALTTLFLVSALKSESLKISQRS